MKIHKIDATNKPLGRLASQIALLLRGKQEPTYQPNIMPDIQVVISNIKNVKLTGNKMSQKKYHHYSGYPGGLVSVEISRKFSQNPAWVLKHAVYGMLASNRMRDKIIRNLIIE